MLFVVVNQKLLVDTLFRPNAILVNDIEVTVFNAANMLLPKGTIRRYFFMTGQVANSSHLFGSGAKHTPND